jgi:hypothetical protein
MDLKLMCGHYDVYSMRCYQVDDDKEDDNHDDDDDDDDDDDEMIAYII